MQEVVTLTSDPLNCKSGYSVRLRKRSKIKKEKEKPSCPDHAPYLQNNLKSFQVFVKAREKSMRLKVRVKDQSD